MMLNPICLQRKKEGLKIFGQGLSNTKVGRKLDFGNKAHSVKPEAQPIGSAVGGWFTDIEMQKTY